MLLPNAEEHNWYHQEETTIEPPGFLRERQQEDFRAMFASIQEYYQSASESAAISEELSQTMQPSGSNSSTLEQAQSSMTLAPMRQITQHGLELPNTLPSPPIIAFNIDGTPGREKTFST